MEKKYGNDKYDSLLEVISVFLKEANFGKVPTTACLAVAGPVTNNKATLTNREHWEIDGETLAKALGLKRIQVVNDFVAMGFGLLTLNEDTECVVLQKAKKNPTAPIACIGAGTGLGECFLTPKGDGNYECYASEGGHAEFAPRNDVRAHIYKYTILCTVCATYTVYTKYTKHIYSVYSIYSAHKVIIFICNILPHIE